MDIPQLDGESVIVRETDAWLERNRKGVVRTYPYYKEVLADIDESTLNEQEKTEERDRATNARADIFGGYPACKHVPPWWNGMV